MRLNRPSFKDTAIDALCYALATVIFVLVVSLGSQYARGAETRDAIVLVGDGCSGVMVHPSGVAMTAKHCGTIKQVRVRLFDDSKYDADLIYTCQESDGPLVYRLRDVTKPLPYLRVADEKPDANSDVILCGFVGADARRYIEWKGTLKYGVMSGDHGDVPVNVIDTPGRPGMSGGPVLDANGHVFGLCRGSTDPSSNTTYISWKATRYAFDSTIKPKELVVFTSVNCPPCKAWGVDRDGLLKDDLKAWKLTACTHDGNRWDRNDLLTEYYSATKQSRDSAISVPTFWVRGSTHANVGYPAAKPPAERKHGFLQWLCKSADSAVSIVVGHRESSDVGTPPKVSVEVADASPPPISATDRSAPPTPIAEVTPDLPPDLSEVTIAILVPRMLGDGVKGMAATAGLKAYEGLLRRRIDEHIHGKAKLELIDERTHPKRFAAVSAAAQVVPEGPYVLVLVGKLPLGLKGLVAGKVERIIEGKLPPGVPVDLVFERLSATTFDDIHRAIATREAGPFERTEPSLPTAGATQPPAGSGPAAAGSTTQPAPPAIDTDDLIGKIISGVSGVVAGKGDTADKPEKSGKLDHILWIVSGLGGAVGAGWIARGWGAYKAARDRIVPTALQVPLHLVDAAVEAAWKRKTGGGSPATPTPSA